MSLDWWWSPRIEYLGRLLQLPHTVEVRVGADSLWQSGNMLVFATASLSPTLGLLCIGEDRCKYLTAVGVAWKPSLDASCIPWCKSWDITTCQHPASIRHRGRLPAFELEGGMQFFTLAAVLHAFCAEISLLVRCSSRKCQAFCCKTGLSPVSLLNVFMIQWQAEWPLFPLSCRRWIFIPKTLSAKIGWLSFFMKPTIFSHITLLAPHHGDVGCSYRL